MQHLHIETKLFLCLESHNNDSDGDIPISIRRYLRDSTLTKWRIFFVHFIEVLVKSYLYGTLFTRKFSFCTKQHSNPKMLREPHYHIYNLVEKYHDGDVLLYWSHAAFTRKRDAYFVRSTEHSHHYAHSSSNHFSLFNHWLSCHLQLRWLQFGKEYSSDDAGDGPMRLEGGEIVDWATRYVYENLPPTQAYIRRMCSYIVYTEEILCNITPTEWLRNFFYIAKAHLMRVRYLQGLRRQSRERKRITGTWRYIFRHRSKPLTLSEQFERNMQSTFNLLWTTFGNGLHPPSKCSGYCDNSQALDNEETLSLQKNIISMEHQDQYPQSTNIVTERFKARRLKTHRSRYYLNHVKQKKQDRKKNMRHSHRRAVAAPLCVVRKRGMFHKIFVFPYRLHGVPSGETESCDYDKD